MDHISSVLAWNGVRLWPYFISESVLNRNTEKVHGTVVGNWEHPFLLFLIPSPHFLSIAVSGDRRYCTNLQHEEKTQLIVPQGLPPGVPAPTTDYPPQTSLASQHHCMLRQNSGLVSPVHNTAPGVEPLSPRDTYSKMSSRFECLLQTHLLCHWLSPLRCPLWEST